jgi:peptidoglycan L-alanyl-D-glutamate endopeptidase CwlK
LFHIIAAAMKRAANELGVKVVWGGDWKSFKDGPQWELA